MTRSADRALPGSGTFCGLCGYQVGGVARCESCGAFRLGHDWHGPDRLRVLTGTGMVRPDPPDDPGDPGDQADPGDAADLAGRHP